MKFLLILLLGFLLFFKLGETRLTNWDEAWYADISRNIVTSNNYLSLQFNHGPFFDKPPLYFWLSSLAFRFFGINEFSARFFSAASGVGVGIVTYSLAKLLFGSKIAVISLAVVLSSIGFLYRSRTGNLDTLLTFWNILSIYSFYHGWIHRSKSWFYIMGVTLGLGFLTKGLILFIFPIIAGLYLIKKKDYATFKKLIIAILLGVGISFGWIISNILVNGNAFLTDFYLNQTGKISTSTYFWKNFSIDYIAYLKSGLKIWFILLIICIPYALYKLRKEKPVILLIYFLLFNMGLTFFENKSNWFLMPIYPIVAIIIGYSLVEFSNKFRKTYFLNFTVYATVFIIGFFHLIRYMSEYIVPDTSLDEAKVALAAKELTKWDDVIYLTNYYYPTIVFYSSRKVFAVYSDNEYNLAWWIKPKTAWKSILSKERVFIITTEEEYVNYKKYFSGYKFDNLFKSGEKMLLKKV